MAKWMYTDATERVACPRCNASKGVYCRMPSGREAKEPHTERMQVLHALPDFNIGDYQITAYTIDQVMAKILKE